MSSTAETLLRSVYIQGYETIEGGDAALPVATWDAVKSYYERRHKPEPLVVACREMLAHRDPDTLSAEMRALSKILEKIL